MGELVKKAETALSNSNPAMPRYRALETMDEMGYNPVQEMIEIQRDLKARRKSAQTTGDPNEILACDIELEFKINKELIGFFSMSQKKSVDLNVQQNGTIGIMPVGFDHLYEGKDLAPCKPRLMNINREPTVVETFMGETEK